MKTKTEKPELKVEVLQSSLEAMADNIAKISVIGKQLENSELSQRAILLLIKDITKQDMYQIDMVLKALPKLESVYLKKRAKKKKK